MTDETLTAAAPLVERLRDLDERIAAIREYLVDAHSRGAVARLGGLAGQRSKTIRKLDALAPPQQCWWHVVRAVEERHG